MPLIQTDPVRAIQMLETQYTRIEKLDPNDHASVEDAQKFLLDDVGKVFGVGSGEWTQIWQNPIIEESRYLDISDGYDDMLDKGSWHAADKAKKVKGGIDETLSRIRRLIDRAKEHAKIHSNTSKGNSMALGLTDDFGTDFVLVKQNAEEIRGRGIRDVAKGRIMIEDEQFPVEVGDLIVFTGPNGKPERYDVVDTGHQPGPPGSDLGHYNVKLRHVSARPAASQIVNNTTTYNNSGQVGAMGPGANAEGNTIIGQATQWNGVDRDRLADELGKLKAQLLAQAGDDDDASAELGPVGEASKALKADNESGFMGAMKKLGSKAWGVVQTLGLTYLDYYGRTQLGLPPAGRT